MSKRPSRESAQESSKTAFGFVRAEDGSVWHNGVELAVPKAPAVNHLYLFKFDGGYAGGGAAVIARSEERGRELLTAHDPAYECALKLEGAQWLVVETLQLDLEIAFDESAERVVMFEPYAE